MYVICIYLSQGNVYFIQAQLIKYCCYVIIYIKKVNNSIESFGKYLRLNRRNILMMTNKKTATYFINDHGCSQ